LPATATLAHASSFTRPLPIEVPTPHDKAFYPDLAQIKHPEWESFSRHAILKPDVLEATKQNIIKYGFSWMHLPYTEASVDEALEAEQNIFKHYADSLFQYFHINSRAKVKDKDWMNPAESKKKGNNDFHQDYPHQKGFLSLVYGGRQNIHGGHFELRNKAQNVIYRIPNVNKRFTVVSFRDNEFIFHRSTPRLPIVRPKTEAEAPPIGRLLLHSPSVVDDLQTPRHTILAFRGYQGKSALPFHYGEDTST
jgi:hypothetical protein